MENSFELGELVKITSKIDDEYFMLGILEYEDGDETGLSLCMDNEGIVYSEVIIDNYDGVMFPYLEDTKFSVPMLEEGNAWMESVKTSKASSLLQ